MDSKFGYVNVRNADGEWETVAYDPDTHGDDLRAAGDKPFPSLERAQEVMAIMKAHESAS